MSRGARWGVVSDRIGLGLGSVRNPSLSPVGGAATHVDTRSRPCGRGPHTGAADAKRVGGCVG